MTVPHVGFASTSFLVLTFLAGCTSRPADTPSADPETPVRERFTALQSALKTDDPDKLWDLLAARSQADAERAAKEIQAMHAQASADEKSKQLEALGLDAAQVAALSAKDVLKTKRFRHKYEEVPVSQVEKVVIQGEHATVHFLEPDGDHEKLVFVRENDQWRAWLMLPKFKQP